MGRQVSKLTASLAMTPRDVFIKPPRLRPGDTIGIFTPSMPGHTQFPARFRTAVANLEQLGFNVALGRVTGRFTDQGYRMTTGIERARELNELFLDDSISLIMSTIGGANSASMLDYLDYDAIKSHPKIFCGYSDVSSLHMAINKMSGLSTLYGPAVVPSFGDTDGVVAGTLSAFLRQVQECWKGEFEPPGEWFHEASDWKSAPGIAHSRQWKRNSGFRCVQEGFASGVSLAANVNTLVSLAGTRYFPDFRNKILFLEEMFCPLSRFERNLIQLRHAGAFIGIKGIVLSKPEIYDSEGAPFDDCDLLVEILDESSIPIIGNFDCGHTHPMLSIPQGVRFEIDARWDGCQIRQIDAFADK